MRALAAGLFVVLLASVAPAVDITGCGQAVPEGDVGVMVADVSCGGAFVGVTLADRATLDMNGHQLSDASGQGVRCEGRRCRIVGPGEVADVTGSSTSAGIGGPAQRVQISDIDIHDCTLGIAFSQDKRAKVTLADVTANDNESFGISVSRLNATNVIANGNGIAGISVGRNARGETIVASGNGTVGLPSFGIIGAKVRLVGLTAQGNIGPGVAAEHIALDGSVVTGNSPLGNGADLSSPHRPRLRSTTCGRSQRTNTVEGQDWDVCTLD